MQYPQLFANNHHAAYHAIVCIAKKELRNCGAPQSYEDGLVRPTI
jgi:hypothetical protein